MAIKKFYNRDDYVKAVRTIGESIARRAEEIVPDCLLSVRDIDIFGNVEPGAIATFSWTVNAYAVDDDGRLAAIANEVDG